MRKQSSDITLKHVFFAVKYNQYNISSEAIQRKLKISKSSANFCLNELISMGCITRINIKRGRYYKVSGHNCEYCTEEIQYET